MDKSSTSNSTVAALTRPHAVSKFFFFERMKEKFNYIPCNKSGRYFKYDINVVLNTLKQTGYWFALTNVILTIFHFTQREFVCIWEQTAIISLYSINWLVCITETECVHCAVRTGSLYIILRSAQTVYLCVLCGSENKQRLFPYTALTD